MTPCPVSWAWLSIYARGTKWCTSDPLVSFEYLQRGPIFVIFTRDEEGGLTKLAQYALDLYDHDEQLMDIKDQSLLNYDKVWVNALLDTLRHLDHGQGEISVRGVAWEMVYRQVETESILAIYRRAIQTQYGNNFLSTDPPNSLPDPEAFFHMDAENLLQRWGGMALSRFHFSPEVLIDAWLFGPVSPSWAAISEWMIGGFTQEDSPTKTWFIDRDGHAQDFLLALRRLQGSDFEWSWSGPVYSNSAGPVLPAFVQTCLAILEIEPKNLSITDIINLADDLNTQKSAAKMLGQDLRDFMETGTVPDWASLEPLKRLPIKDTQYFRQGRSGA